MPVGSRYEMTWYDFELYLHDFEDFVEDKVFDKMSYSMWRRIKYKRPDNTPVFIEVCRDSFVLTIGNEPEYHRFHSDDNSFGEFFFENFINPEEKYYDAWGGWAHEVKEKARELSNVALEDKKKSWEDPKVETSYIDEFGNIHLADAPVSVQCTSSNAYPAKNFKLDIASCESTNKEALLSALKNAPVMTISGNHEPSISCVIDTKVDKAEFDARLDELTEKLSTVINKYENNNEKKENVSMKGFNFDFGPMNGNVVRMSVYGMAMKNKVGTWVSYDVANKEIMDVDVFNFDGAKFLYKMPVAIKDVAVGDVIIHMSVPMFVTGISEDGKAVYAVDPVAGERKEIMLTKSPFGFNFITKVINFLGNAFTADANNPFGNVGMMMLMMGDGDNKMNDMLPLMLMANGGNIDMSNPLMMYALMSGDGKMGDMLPFMLMMNANKPAVTPVCNCGQNHQ